MRLPVCLSAVRGSSSMSRCKDGKDSGLTPLESMASGTAVGASLAGVFSPLAVEDGGTRPSPRDRQCTALTTAIQSPLAKPALAEKMVMSDASARKSLDRRRSRADRRGLWEALTRFSKQFEIGAGYAVDRKARV